MLKNRVAETEEPTRQPQAQRWKTGDARGVWGGKDSADRKQTQSHARLFSAHNAKRAERYPNAWSPSRTKTSRPLAAASAMPSARGEPSALHGHAQALLAALAHTPYYGQQHKKKRSQQHPSRSRSTSRSQPYVENEQTSNESGSDASNRSREPKKRAASFSTSLSAVCAAAVGGGGTGEDASAGGANKLPTRISKITAIEQLAKKGACDTEEQRIAAMRNKGVRSKTRNDHGIDRVLAHRPAEPLRWANAVCAELVDPITQFLSVRHDAKDSTSFLAYSQWWLHQWQAALTNADTVSRYTSAFFTDPQCRKAYICVFKSLPEAYEGVNSAIVFSQEDQDGLSGCMHLVNSFTRARALLVDTAVYVKAALRALPTTDLAPPPADIEEIVALQQTCVDAPRGSREDAIARQAVAEAKKRCKSLVPSEAARARFLARRQTFERHITSHTLPSDLHCIVAKALRTKVAVQLDKLGLAYELLVPAHLQAPLEQLEETIHDNASGMEMRVGDGF